MEIPRCPKWDPTLNSFMIFPEQKPMPLNWDLSDPWIPNPTSPAVPSPLKGTHMSLCLFLILIFSREIPSPTLQKIIKLTHTPASILAKPSPSPLGWSWCCLSLLTLAINIPGLTYPAHHLLFDTLFINSNRLHGSFNLFIMIILASILSLKT